MKKLIIILFFAGIALQSQAQWSVVGAAFKGDVRAIYFADENTGYAAGGNFAQGYIAKTTDGGVTWSKTTVSATLEFRALSFVSPDTGYVCGYNGVLFKTTDAGGSWTNIYTNASQTFRALDFVSSSTGFMGGIAGTIWKTTDGGLTWASYSLGITSDVIQLDMIDANNGYACCSSATTPVINGYVFNTTDGGSTWTQVYADATKGFLGIAVVDANTAYVGGRDQTIIKTIDGGNTWITSFLGYAGPAIRAGFVVSEDKIFMTDDAGYIQNTDDAGATWSNVFYVPQGLYSLSFPTSSIGYAGNVSGHVYKYVAGAACTIDAPTGLTSAVLSSTSAKLYWTAPAGAVRYSLKYKNINSTWKALTCYQSARVLNDLTPGTKYSWSVKAYCGSPGAGSSAWSEQVKFKTDPLRIENSEISSLFEVYPNPVSSTATISFSLDKESKVIADLFTIDGKKVMSIADQQFPSGANQITMNRGSLSAGTYILQIKTNGDLLTKKVELQ